MEEKLTMDDYATELEASLRKVQEGDVLTGTVIGVSDTEVTVDLKSYTDGIIRAEDYSEDPSFSIKNDVHVGEPLPFCAQMTARDISFFPERPRRTMWPGKSCSSIWRKKPCWT